MKIATYILITLIPLFLILTGFRFVVFDREFYSNEFAKYGVYDQLGKDTADSNSNELIGYLAGKNELNTDFFNDREKTHLLDVKELIKQALFTFNIIGIIILLPISYLIVNKRFNELGNVAFFSGITTLILLILFIGAIAYDFDKLFLGFHLVSFNNDLWMLNPETDNLIAMFPEGFFYDISMRMAVITGILSSVLMIAGLIARHYPVKTIKY